MQESTDIIIFGAGLAGLSAAHEIHTTHPEVSVIIISDHTPISTCVMGFSAPVNSPDSPAVFAEDTRRLGRHQAPDELVRTLAERALPELHRAEALGIAFDHAPDGTYACVKAVGSTVARVVHHGTDTGRMLLQALKTDVRQGRLTQLLVENNCICGAVVNGSEIIAAKAIVLATGGACGLWNYATWNSHADGSGLAAAVNAGAATENLQSVQFEPTVVFQPGAAQGSPIITTVLHEGAQLLDSRGNNIITDLSQMVSKRAIATAIQTTIDKGLGNPDGTVTYDFNGMDLQAFRQKYAGYWDRYRSLSTMPDGLSFHVRPAAHTTLGGLRITARTETSVQGLFAAGEITGSVHGADRLGGNAGLETLVFGRIAGQRAADYALQSAFIPFTPAALVPFPDAAVFQACRDCLTEAITVIPSRQQLEIAERRLHQLPDCLYTKLLHRVFAATREALPC